MEQKEETQGLEEEWSTNMLSSSGQKQQTLLEEQSFVLEGVERRLSTEVQLGEVSARCMQWAEELRRSDQKSLISSRCSMRWKVLFSLQALRPIVTIRSSRPHLTSYTEGEYVFCITLRRS